MNFNERQIKMSQKAIQYMEKLLQGINPVDGSRIENESFVYDEKVRNCFRYIRSVLETHSEALQDIPKNRHIYQQIEDFNLTFEERKSIPVTNDCISEKEFINNINTLIDANFVKPLKRGAVKKWLLRKGFLEEVVGYDKKKHKWPTDAGKEIGLSLEKRVSEENHVYTVMMFNRDAQQFVADNIGEIIEVNKEKRKRNRGTSEKLEIPEMPELNE